LKNGKQEVYTLSLSPEKKAFEERCGIREVAIASTEALTEVKIESVNTLATPIKERIITTVAKPAEVSVGTIADDFEITDEKAVMHLRNGKTEEYNLKNPKEREAFEKKFGKIISPSVSVTTAAESVKVVPAQPGYSVTTVQATRANEVTVIGTEDELIIREEQTLFTITQKTTSEELESLIKKIKEKGYELKFTNKDYNDGALTQISGTVKYKDSNSSFSATDFNKLIISTYRDGDKIRFKVFIGTKKVVS